MPTSFRPFTLKISSFAVLSAVVLGGHLGCSETPGPGGTGGSATGGAASGGAVGSGGGVGTGGGPGTGGASTGGTSSGGGSSSGGGPGSGGAPSSGGSASGGGTSSGGSASGGSDGSGGGDGFEPCPATGACKIVPFGDSITEGMVRVGGSYEFNGGYRVHLFELAVGDSHDVTFVGNAPAGQNPPNGPDTVAGQPFPKAHEGMSGWTIQQLIDKDTYWDISDAADDPHIVLLHIGTNDINLNQQDGASDRLETLIDQITTDLPDALLVVAKIIPLPSRTSDIDTYNGTMDAIIEEKVSAGKHVLLVDMNSDYPDGQLPDNIHPSADGYAWMAEKWYEAIEPYLP